MAEDLEGTARLAGEVPRRIANAHTLFNVANTLLFLGFTTQPARLVERLAPDRPGPRPEVKAPKYLNEDALVSPLAALEMLRLEASHVGERAQRRSRACAVAARTAAWTRPTSTAG